MKIERVCHEQVWRTEIIDTTRESLQEALDYFGVESFDHAQEEVWDYLVANGKASVVLNDFEQDYYDYKEKS